MDLLVVLESVDGAAHVLGLTATGRVWAWGANPHGELGVALDDDDDDDGSDDDDDAEDVTAMKILAANNTARSRYRKKKR